MKEPVTRLDDCQYLLVSQIHYPLPHFADHCEPFSHDAIHRYRGGERMTPRGVWDNGRTQGVPTPQGYLGCDDTVLDKKSAQAIELVRQQYRGNAQAVINGMGTVTGGYVNPPLEHFWLIDYRLSDPAGDGKRTLDPGRDLLLTGVSPQQLPVAAVLMATWYATQALLLLIDSGQKSSYGPLKDNRHGADARGPQPYQRVEALTGKAPE